MTITVEGISGVRALLLNAEEAVRNATWYAMLNTAEKTKGALQDEIGRVFSDPTPLIQNGLRIATDKPAGLVQVAWKDVFGKNEPTVEHRGEFYADAISRTLIPNIDGGERVAKPSERQLRAAGIIGPNEFIVPSRTAPLNRYGNISGAVMSKILSDLGSYKMAGAPGTTKESKRQYIFGKVGDTRGIFKVGKDLEKSRWKLIFLVVKGAPRYSKRLRFYETAVDEFERNFQNEFDRVFERELRKRR